MILGKECPLIDNIETQQILSHNVHSYVIEKLGTISKARERELSIKYDSEASQRPEKRKA